MVGTSAREFRQLLESTRALPWRAWGDDLRFTWVGPQAQELLGYANEEWLSAGFLERALHPDDRATTIAAYRDAGRSARSVERDYRLVASDGHTIWVHSLVHVARRTEGRCVLHGLLFDVTGLVHDREARSAMNDLDRAVLASVPGHVAIVDRDGAIIGGNDAWAERSAIGGWDVTPTRTGVSGNYLEACRTAARMGELDAQRALGCIGDVLTGRTPRAAFEYERTTGDERKWFEMRVERLRRPEGGAVIAHLDITERRRGELELQRHRHELARVARAITAGELVGAIAHELRQPLLTIRANTQAAIQLLAADRLDLGLVRESLIDAVEENRRASDILRSVHDLVARRDPIPETVELNALVHDVLRIVTADASVRGVAITLSLDPELDPVDGDRVQLQQVVLNLVINAIDASADARSAQRRFFVETRRPHPGWVELCVRDGGPGLPADAPHRVFEPFYTTKPEGVGLGLAVVRSIVLAHGGRVSAENDPVGGAIFRVALPTVLPPRRRIGRDA